MTQLTKAEEQIMKKLWLLEKATVRQILEEMPEPKPAYNTVSTIVRILEKKGIVDHYGKGKTFTYYPLLAQEDYKKQSLKALISGYFEGSFGKMASFFAKEEDLSTSEIEELVSILKERSVEQD